MGCLKCEMFVTWDILNVGCFSWEYGVLRLLYVWNVGCLGCWMYGAWYVGDKEVGDV